MRIKNILLSALIAAGCIFGMTACSSDGGASDNSGTNSTSAPGNSYDPSDSSDPDSGAVSGSDIAGNVGDITPQKGDLIAEIEINGFGTIRAVLFPDAAPTGVENFRLLAEDGYYNGLTIHRVVSDFMFQGGSLNGDGTGGDALVNGGSFGIETDSNVRHFYGALCYANAMGTNTTQFYIVNNKQPQELGGDYSNIYAYADQYEQAANSASTDIEKEYYSFQADYYRNMASSAENATEDIKNKYKEVGGTPSLDGNYTVFGQVYEGFDVIESVSAVKVEDNGMGEVSKPVQEITISSVKVYEFEG
ncbi:MAG: peptidylprolyl isomerase [Oscillospiraceae bacterium]|nr:peptidylprolyl isomerase [Oscillospiraceae bacterium]